MRPMQEINRGYCRLAGAVQDVLAAPDDLDRCDENRLLRLTCAAVADSPRETSRSTWCPSRSKEDRAKRSTVEPVTDYHRGRTPAEPRPRSRRGTGDPSWSRLMRPR